jgi:hypothetical protein
MIENINEDEIDGVELKKELKNDLTRLLREAKKKKGDPITKKIVENIDPWLITELEYAINEFGESPMN